VFDIGLMLDWYWIGTGAKRWQSYSGPDTPLFERHVDWLYWSNYSENSRTVKEEKTMSRNSLNVKLFFQHMTHLWYDR